MPATKLGPEDRCYLGLMSGTSMDGITAVVATFPEDSLPKLLHQVDHGYPTKLRSDLENLVSPNWKGPLSELSRLDHQVAAEFATAACSAIEPFSKSQIKAIGSHGQTVYHRPPPDHPNSLQIGDPSLIAEKTGIRVVADFRRRDMAAGGQGAPLVPAFHHYLFGADETTAVLNLGGIANITLLGEDDPTHGFDTGPANTLLDQWILKNNGKNYDKNGEWARQGSVDSLLLEELLKDPFFSLLPPKSTGREKFNIDWLTNHPALLRKAIDPKDVQATLAELTARSVADALITQKHGLSRLIVCGGGAFNTFLMERIQANLENTQIINSQTLGIPPDSVEAMAFAWLAKQTLTNQPGNLPKATGASGPRILGGIYQA